MNKFGSIGGGNRATPQLQNQWVSPALQGQSSLSQVPRAAKPLQSQPVPPQQPSKGQQISRSLAAPAAGLGGRGSQPEAVREPGVPVGSRAAPREQQLGPREDAQRSPLGCERDRPLAQTPLGLGLDRGGKPQALREPATAGGCGALREQPRSRGDAQRGPLGGGEHIKPQLRPLGGRGSQTEGLREPPGPAGNNSTAALPREPRPSVGIRERPPEETQERPQVPKKSPRETPPPEPQQPAPLQPLLQHQFQRQQSPPPPQSSQQKPLTPQAPLTQPPQRPETPKAPLRDALQQLQPPLQQLQPQQLPHQLPPSPTQQEQLLPQDSQCQSFPQQQPPSLSQRQQEAQMDQAQAQHRGSVLDPAGAAAGKGASYLLPVKPPGGSSGRSDAGSSAAGSSGQPVPLTAKLLQPQQQQAPTSSRAKANSNCSSASTDWGRSGLSQPGSTDKSPLRQSPTLLTQQQQQPQQQPQAPQAQQALSRRELELRVQELERTNAELERRLDTDGFKFLEAIVASEREVEQLTEKNSKLLEEQAQTEEQLRKQGDMGELRAANLRMEREAQDMLQQLDEFEREKEEELRSVREEVATLSRRLEDQDQVHQRRLAQAEQDNENLLQAMTDEGQELQTRIEKLSRDKEALSMDLAKALARADMAGANSEGAGGGPRASPSRHAEATSRHLKEVMSECETLKDEVTNKDGQLSLLKSQLETITRKLKLTDMENAMLKNELDVLRRNAAAASPRR